MSLRNNTQTTNRTHHAWRKLIEPLSLELVSYPSVTDSANERDFADKLINVLKRIPYFQKHPDHLWAEPILNDPFKRSNVFALVKSNSNENAQDTVLLTGHYDTVSTSNYGSFEPLALKPELLRKKLIEELSQAEPSKDQKLALTDLQSGDFIPARGLLDMKSGLAVGITMLQAFSAQTTATGNLLFIATPDEEKFSYGMRDASSKLAKIAKTHTLNYRACINLDSSSDHGDGSAGQSIYLGSVGKLLTSVFIAGQDTHAGEPLAGINPHWLASFVTQALESNPELSDFAKGEYAPPPTLLKQTDLKTHYDVTTPATVWAMYNVLTHQKTASQVLNEFKTLVTTALNEALGKLNTRAQLYASQRKQEHNAPVEKANIMSFAELKTYVFKKQGEAFQQNLKVFTQSLNDLDAPTQNQKLTEYLWQASGLTGPAAVIGFASLHYPCVSINQETQANKDLIANLKTVASDISNAYQTPISFRQFFAGISDMSWLGKHDSDDLNTVNQNTPSDHMNLNANTLDIPTLNIGPWGRDYHKKLERIHAPYSFEVLPELVWQCCQKIINN